MIFNYGENSRMDENVIIKMLDKAVEKDTKSPEDKYVTLKQLDKFNFFIGSTQDERQKNIIELNRVLEN